MKLSKSLWRPVRKLFNGFAFFKKKKLKRAQVAAGNMGTDKRVLCGTFSLGWHSAFYDSEMQTSNISIFRGQNEENVGRLSHT